MEGPLSKWTNVVKGWQYRWFVLDDNTGLLSYYTVSVISLRILIKLGRNCRKKTHLKNVLSLKLFSTFLKCFVHRGKPCIAKVILESIIALTVKVREQYCCVLSMLRK